MINVKCSFIYLLQYKSDINNGREEKSEDCGKEGRFIKVLNNLGICVSYDEMLRMDYNLLNRLTRSCGENKFLNPSALPALQSFMPLWITLITYRIVSLARATAITLL